MRPKNKGSVSFEQWIRRAYLKTTIIPVAAIQLVCLGIYFGANSWIRSTLSGFLDTAVNNQYGVIPRSSIDGKVNAVIGSLQTVGLLQAVLLLGFLALVFFLMNARLKKMSRDISQPLVELNDMVRRIGAGDYDQEMPEIHVTELRETSGNIVSMGRRLGDINKNLLSAQEDLREKESYLEAVIHSVDDAIIELDENGVITNLFLDAVNQAPRRRTDLISTFLENDRTGMIEKKLREVIDTGRPATVETGFETGNGTRWAQARLSLVSRDPVRVVVTARDITERKEMEESISKARDAAEAASRAKSQFLSNMSHELRTPLNAVLGFAQVLEMDPSTPLNGMQKECVDEIMKAGNHLLELINEVLDLARIEAGKARLSIEPVGIAPVIEETLNMIIPTSEKYGIGVNAREYSCSRGYVMADKVKLKQILINLLSNAIKYNKPGGKVELYCESAGEWVRFHVTDTGIGIPKEELAEIFRPFHRLNQMKNIVEGTGVGLAVVKQLAEMMGGSVSVESEVGIGSRFYVELPSANELTPWESKTGETAEKAQAGSPAGFAKKILYIEDNQANLRLVERILALTPDTRFLSAQSAEAGIEIALKEKPDMILMDINLPGMDGFEAFLKLQENEATRDIPVVAVSSNAMEREVGRAMRMGFFDYIIKPIKADVFFERIRRVFDREQR